MLEHAYIQQCKRIQVKALIWKKDFPLFLAILVQMVKS